jgi:hypothetical protein
MLFSFRLPDRIVAIRLDRILLVTLGAEAVALDFM